MEVRMERRFSMDDLLEAGRVRESAQAQMRRLGWLQPHSARRGREGAGAMSDRGLQASGRRGVGSGERGVGSGRGERGGRGGGSGRGERGGGGGGRGGGGRGVGGGGRAGGGGGGGRGGRGGGGGSAERGGSGEARGSPMPRSGACRWRALQCGGYARLKPRLRRGRCPRCPSLAHDQHRALRSCG